MKFDALCAKSHAFPADLFSFAMAPANANQNRP
jgi:hypothetical protein